MFFSMRLSKLLVTIVFVGGLAVLIAGCVASAALIAPGIVAVLLGGVGLMMTSHATSRAAATI